MKINEDKNYLGRLCQFGHDFEGTGKSLRYRANRECVECKKEYQKDHKEEHRLINKKYAGTHIEERKEYYNKPTVKRRRRNYEYLKLYGITQEEYNNMYEIREGKCDICSDFKMVLCIDHNHTTGEVRGLLCSTCNFMLGNSKDSPEILVAGAKYLEKK